MKNILLILFLGLLSYCLLGQQQTFLPHPKSSSLSTNFDKQFINNSYSGDYKAKSDTIWLYTKFRIFLWENGNYEPWETYNVFEYSSVHEYGKWDREYNINSFTHDTIFYTIFVYDSLKRKTSQTLYIYDTIEHIWKHLDKWLYWHDQFNNDTIALWQTWNESEQTWENHLRHKRKYNERNFLMEDVTELWNVIYDYWFVNNGYKYEYIVNEDLCVDTLYWYEWNTISNNWMNNLKKYWIYDENNVPTEYVFEVWDPYENKYWNYQRFFKLEYLDWPGCENIDHNYEPIIVKFNQQDWYDEWIDIVRFFAEVDSLGGSYSFFQKYQSYEWVNWQSYETRFNDKNYHLFHFMKTWIDNKWIIDWGDTSIYTFEGSNVIQELKHEWDTVNQNGWLPKRKFLREDYVWFLGTSENQTGYIGGDEKLKLIPNPSAGSITIQLTDNNSRIKEIDIFNIIGMTVFKKKYGKMGKQKIILDISTFEKGIYIVEVKTQDNKIFPAKLVKE